MLTWLKTFFTPYHYAGRPVPPPAPPARPKVILAKKHTGMRISARGLIRNAGNVMRGRNAEYYRGCTEMLGKQLQEAADRYYRGDTAAADEFFQLYSLDNNRPDAA